MSKIDVRAINLNLLPALEALLVEGNVGAAARRVHVSQSAMSHSLARLREVFGDPLFVQSGRKMVRTAMAERLAAELPGALDGLERACAAPAPFAPATSRRVFRIATFDFFELALLPDLLAYLGARAPGIEVEVERFTPAHVPALVAGEIDVALLGDVALPMAGLRREPLADDPFVVLARRGNRRIKRRLDLDTYLALGHVVVSVEGRRDGPVDRALVRLGRTRRVVLRVPHFMSAPLAVMRSDHVCTLARVVAARASELFDLRVMPVPLDVPPARAVAFWSRRAEADDGGRWFRELLLTRAFKRRSR